MAGVGVSDPLEQFTKIKELELMPEKAPEEAGGEDGVCQVKEHPHLGEVEAEGTLGALQPEIPEVEQEVELTTTQDSEKQLLTLQTVHLGPGDLEPQALLWLGDGSQQNVHQCTAIEIQEQVYSLQEVNLVQFHVLEEHVAMTSGDGRFLASPSESTALIEVQQVLRNGPLTRGGGRGTW